MNGDFKATTGSITIPAGSTSVTFSVLVKGDLAAENHETFSVTLFGANSVPIIDDTGVITILNDDSVKAKVKAVATAEGSSVVLTFTLTKQYYQDVVLTITTFDGTATFGSGDYEWINGMTIVIPAGQTVATYSIPTYTDGLRETPERFTLVTTSPDLASAPAVKTCVIKGNVT